jgi:hypothetical protein
VQCEVQCSEERHGAGILSLFFLSQIFKEFSESAIRANNRRSSRLNKSAATSKVSITCDGQDTCRKKLEFPYCEMNMEFAVSIGTFFTYFA